MKLQEKPVSMVIGKNIRTRREAMGWQGMEIARALHVSHRQLQRWERGKESVPAPYLLWLGQRFGVEIGYFYREVIA